MKRALCLLLALLLMTGCQSAGVSNAVLEKIQFTQVDVAVTSFKQVTEGLKATKITYQYTYDAFQLTLDVGKDFDKAVLSSIPYTSPQDTTDPSRVTILVRYDALEADFLVKLAGYDTVQRIYVGVPNGKTPE